MNLSGLQGLHARGRRFRKMIMELPAAVCAAASGAQSTSNLRREEEKNKKKDREFRNSLLRRSLAQDCWRVSTERGLGLMTKRNEGLARATKRTEKRYEERTAEAVSANHGSRLGESVFGPSNVVRAPAASQRECRWRLWQQSFSRSRSSAAVSAHVP